MYKKGFLLICALSVLRLGAYSFQDGVDFLKNDIQSFLNTKISIEQLADFTLDAVFLNASGALADRCFGRHEWYNNMASLCILAPFMAINEGFRIKYGKRKPTVTKNIVYAALFVLLRNKGQ